MRRLFPLLLTIIILSWITSSSYWTLPQERDYIAKIKDHHKIEAMLRHLVVSLVADPRNIQRNIPSRLLLDVESEANAIRVIIEVEGAGPGYSARIVDAVQSLQGSVERSSRRVVQALIPPSALPQLADLTEVRFIRLPLHPLRDTVTSEGVGIVGGDVWHSAGWDGEGVKIGILDDFRGYRGLLGRELPSSSNVVVRSFRADGNIEGDPEDPGSDHGTAVAEIIFDMAPKAKFYLANYDSGEGLLEAISWLQEEGVDVINTSWSIPIGCYGDDNPLDLQLLALVEAGGTLWVTSAGNYARSHWEDDWRDDDGDSWLNFSSRDEGLTISAEKGDDIEVYLSWDDPCGRSSNDYDLFIYNSDLSEVISGGISDNIQDGDDYPREAIITKAPYTGNYHIAVKKKRATRSARLEIFVPANPMEGQHIVPESSLMWPASSPYVLTVGATAPADDSYRPYSSQGPTNDGRTKPDLSAPDCVSTSTYGSAVGDCALTGFPGTSASTPLVAGAAALVKQAHSSYHPSDIQGFLEGRAIDLGPRGKDNKYGSGRLDLGRPPEVIPPLERPAAPSRLEAEAVSETRIDLSWRDNSDNEEGFEIYRSKEGGSYSRIKTVGKNVENYSDTGLDPGTEYCYKVRAYNDAGSSSFSNVDCATTIRENRPPRADAGDDQEVRAGETVYLDGSDSSDPDGDRLSYYWSFVSRPSGSRATLSSPTSVRTSFVADVEGEYIVELEVEDEGGLSDTDRVKITALIATYEFAGELRQGTFGKVEIPERIKSQLPPFVRYHERPNTTRGGRRSDSLGDVGLQLSESTGTILGTPTSSGEFQFLIEAHSDDVAVALIWALITIEAPPPVYEFRGGLRRGEFGRVEIPETIKSRLPSFVRYQERPNALLNGRTSDRLVDVGLTLNGSTGTIIGTPTQAGEFQFLIDVLSGDEVVAHIWAMITVKAPPPIYEFEGELHQGRFGRLEIPAVIKRSLPSFARYRERPNTELNGRTSDSLGDVGLQLSESTGTIIGTPTQAGRFQFLIDVLSDDEVVAHIWANVTVAVANRPPRADFSFSPEHPTTRDTVKFTDHSTDPDGQVVSWRWNFGDGSTSTEQHPSHRYVNNGTYTVELIVTDDKGAQGKAQKEIIVTSILEYEFAAEMEEGVYGEIVLPDGIRSSLPDDVLFEERPYATRGDRASDSLAEVGLHLEGSTGTIYGTPTRAGSFQFLIAALSAGELVAEIWAKVTIKPVQPVVLSRMVVRNDGNGDGKPDSEITSIKERNGSKITVTTVAKHDCDGSGDLESSTKIITESDTTVALETVELPETPQLIEERKTQTITTKMSIERHNVCEGVFDTAIIQTETVITTHTTKERETGRVVSERITITIDEDGDGTPETFIEQQGTGVNALPVEIKTAIEKRGLDLGGPNNFVTVTTTATQTITIGDTTTTIELSAITALVTDPDGRTSAATHTGLRTSVK